MAKSYDEYRLGEPYERPRRKGLKTLAILAAMMAITILPAMAAKGGGGKGGGGGSTGGTTGGGGLTLVMVKDVNGNGSPNQGDTIRWIVSTTATDQPRVDMPCYQGGTLVYYASTGYYDSYPWPYTQNMVLSSNSWTSGGADCTAKLYYVGGSRSTTISTYSFHVDA
jgi:hypothetical protein